MKRLHSALIVTLLIVSAYGFIDRKGITLQARSQPRLVTVRITLNDVGDTYRWLGVYGCSAELSEDSPAPYCNGFWERDSGFEIDGTKKFHQIEWRDLPGGTMLIIAVARDADGKQIASGQTTLFRGR